VALTESGRVRVTFGEVGAHNRSGKPLYHLLSVPNFYGAHGYAPWLRNISAIFFAAGPDIRSGSLMHVHNIDVAPTVAQILGVKLSSLVQERALCEALVHRCKGER
jgi:hypothetical protein